MDEQDALISGLQSQLQRSAADVAARDSQLASLNEETASLRTRVAELTSASDQQLLQAGCCYRQDAKLGRARAASDGASVTSADCWLLTADH